MRENDGHVGKIDSHVVDIHRVTVLQPDASAATHSCADSAVARVKDDRQAGFVDDFIKRIDCAIVRMELLQRRMKLGVSFSGGEIYLAVGPTTLTGALRPILLD